MSPILVDVASIGQTPWRRTERARRAAENAPFKVMGRPVITCDLRVCLFGRSPTRRVLQIRYPSAPNSPARLSHIAPVSGMPCSNRTVPRSGSPVMATWKLTSLILRSWPADMAPSPHLVLGETMWLTSSIFLVRRSGAARHTRSLAARASAGSQRPKERRREGVSSGVFGATDTSRSGK